MAGAPTGAAEFQIDGRPALDALAASRHREFVDDPQSRACFAPIRRPQTVPIERAVWQVGMFGNQNTVCKTRAPRWRSTAEKLKTHIPDYHK